MLQVLVAVLGGLSALVTFMAWGYVLGQRNTQSASASSIDVRNGMLLSGAAALVFVGLIAGRWLFPRTVVESVVVEVPVTPAPSPSNSATPTRSPTQTESAAADSIGAPPTEQAEEATPIPTFLEPEPTPTPAFDDLDQIEMLDPDSDYFPRGAGGINPEEFTDAWWIKTPYTQELVVNRKYKRLTGRLGISDDSATSATLQVTIKDHLGNILFRSRSFRLGSGFEEFDIDISNAMRIFVECEDTDYRFSDSWAGLIDFKFWKK